MSIPPYKYEAKPFPILDLPEHVLKEVMEKLYGKDLVNFAEACRLFMVIAWRRRITFLHRKVVVIARALGHVGWLERHETYNFGSRWTAKPD